MIEDGRVIAEGTHAELLATEPRYVEILAHTSRSDVRATPEQLEAAGLRTRSRTSRRLHQLEADSLARVQHQIGEDGLTP